MSTSTKYSGPNPEGDIVMELYHTHAPLCYLISLLHVDTALLELGWLG